MVTYTKLANLKGPKGDAGTFVSASAESVSAASEPEAIIGGTPAASTVHFKIPEGRQGLPGVNAVENDTAIASYIADPESATSEQLESAFMRAEAIDKTNGTQADLQGAIDRAAAKGVPLRISGTYTINGTLTGATQLDMVGVDNPVITQTAALTPHMTFTTVERVNIQGVTFIGLGTDYVNTDVVYGATALRFTGNNTDITVQGCTISNVAGAGVFVSTGTTKRVKVKGCTITGVGRTITGQFSGGIIIQDGIADINVSGNDVSHFAQCVSIGHGSKRIHITDNRLHDTSEHGGYFAVSDNYVIRGNHFYDTGLLGFKIQLGKTGYTCKSAVISGNILENTGSNSVMVTNAGLSTEPFIENLVITGNVVSASGDTGFRIDYAHVVKLADNIVHGARFGIRVHNSDDIDIRGNTVRDIERPGLWLENVSNVTVDGNRMTNLGIVGPEKIGVYTTGTITNLDLTNNRVDYTTAAQSDGLLLVAGTYTNVRMTGNYFRAANWGFRIAGAEAAITKWRDNVGVGGLGASDAYPTGFAAAIPDTSAATLVALEAEVNKLKAVLRTQRDIR